MDNWLARERIESLKDEPVVGRRNHGQHPNRWEQVQALRERNRFSFARNPGINGHAPTLLTKPRQSKNFIAGGRIHDAPILKLGCREPRVVLQIKPWLCSRMRT